MSLYVLDTDTLSLLQEGNAAVVALVAACAAEDLAISVITVEEQLSGWLEHQAIVVTRNVRDFERVPNLVVEDWSK